MSVDYERLKVPLLKSITGGQPSKVFFPITREPLVLGSPNRCLVDLFSPYNFVLSGMGKFGIKKN